MLKKLHNNGNDNPKLTCRQLVLENYDILLQSASYCENSGALILTTADVDEIDVIIR